MFRLGKLTDYGIVLLTYCAAHAERSWSARALSELSEVPLPTVSKILKKLARAEILDSSRGSGGGYRLSRPARDISIAEVICAIDGPIALTDCSTEEPTTCGIEEQCPTRDNWQRINTAVVSSLTHLTLADMKQPTPRVEEELIQLSVR